MSGTNQLKQQTIFGFIWRFLQNAGTQVIGFIVSIVLARILMPSDYGLIAMITVFTSIASVFITTGFSSSVIQKKDLSEIDKNTIFICGLITAIILYLVLFFSASAISRFYHEEKLVSLLRVQSLSLIISASYSTHGAILSREMKFKKSFISSLSGVIVQGIVGISLAYGGYGPWALVFSYLANSIVCAVITWIIVKWIPNFSFSGQSFKTMFSFSFKLLCLSLINNIFQNVHSLIIGRQYSSSDLAYYNRGAQFPNLIMQQVDGAMNAVLFSSLSKYQDDWDSGLRVLRHAMRISLFVCMPLMIGLCAIAEPMVLVLLTDKWIDSVPFIRIAAIICLFWPLSARTNALNAMGKSGITLLLSLSSHALTLVFILLTYKISVLVMVSSPLFATCIFLVIGAFVYQKHLNYRVVDQIMDILPTLVISLIMGVIVYFITWIGLKPLTTLAIQLVIGPVVYLFLAYLTKNKAFTYLRSNIQPYLTKDSRNNR